MISAKQLFNAACDRALSEMRDVPVGKILFRLHPGVVQGIESILAEQFRLMLHNAAAGVDVTRPAPRLRDWAPPDPMRDVTPEHGGDDAA
jgi:hypothetical protein